MAAELDGRGEASGWIAYRDPFGKAWKWTAYGPNGSEEGEAENWEAAAAAATKAQDRLR